MRKALLSAGFAAMAFTAAMNGSNMAQAQYTGPSEKKITSVSDAIEHGKDDSYIQLEGKILRQVGGEKYIFADETGEIRVEIDNDVFSVPVNEDTMVQIRGEFEKDFLQSPEIDVDAIIVKTGE